MPSFAKVLDKLPKEGHTLFQTYDRCVLAGQYALVNAYLDNKRDNAGYLSDQAVMAFSSCGELLAMAGFKKEAQSLITYVAGENLSSGHTW